MPAKYREYCGFIGGECLVPPPRCCDEGGRTCCLFCLDPCVELIPDIETLEHLKARHPDRAGEIDARIEELQEILQEER